MKKPLDYMEKKEIITLIIPDVHGRAFWRQPLSDIMENTDAKAVFLGDYLDPYPEEFSNERGAERFACQEYAIDVFKDIIAAKKKYGDRIVLLLGNHDCGYAVGREVCECRYDYRHAEEIIGLFNENRSLFQLAYEETVNGRHIIYSHAGISQDYAHAVFGKDVPNEENIVGLLNDAWKVQDGGVLKTLAIFDCYRGWGGGDFASPVWTDVREWANRTSPQKGYGYQVFGHTLLMKPVVTERWADLDAKVASVLYSDGEIGEYAV